MFSLAPFKQDKEAGLLSDLLPWAMLVAPGVIEQKDGLLQKTFAFRGPDLESESRQSLISTIARLNNSLKRLGGGWSLFLEAQRGFSTNYPESQFPDAASQALEDERKASFRAEGEHFETKYFLTFVRKPNRLDSNGPKQAFEIFEKEVNRIVSLVHSIVPFIRELSDEETLTYLHSTISTKRHKVSVPEIPMYLDAVLSDQTLYCGMENRLDGSFLKTVTVRSFPGSSFPGVLDALNNLEFEYRWMSRFILLAKQEARKEITRYKKGWASQRKGMTTVLQEEATQSESVMGNSHAEGNVGDADDAMVELEGDYTSFGFYTGTVTVFGKTSKEANQRASAVESAINNMGFTAYVEGINSTQAWLGSLPGHVYANVRRPLVNSLNFSHLIPFGALWEGKKENTHLKGPSLFVAKTSGSTPFYFSPNVGDVGHTLILGPTGAGKSTLLSFMALQFLRYPEAQVFFFDKGRSARAATLSVGGQFSNVGSSEDGLVFQPLSRVHEEKECIWAAGWLSDLVLEQGGTISPEKKDELWGALESLASMPSEERTLSSYISLLQDKELSNALKPYSLSGPYGSILDSAEDSLEVSKWQCFETEALMNKKGLVFPVLSYLFHRLEERFDGSPTLLILDEAWLFLDNPQFKEKIREWLKTLRKANVYVVFATQSISDAMNSSIYSAITESCLTKIFLPNAMASEEKMRRFYEGMGLNDTQVNLIARSIPKREYYVHSEEGSRLFELGLGPVGLALCASSNAKDQAFMDGITSLKGPEFFKKLLRSKSGESL